MSLFLEIAVIENGGITISSKIRQSYFSKDPKSVLELGIYPNDLTDIYLGNFDRGCPVLIQEHTWRCGAESDGLRMSIDRAYSYLRRHRLRFGAVNKTIRNR